MVAATELLKLVLLGLKIAFKRRLNDKEVKLKLYSYQSPDGYRVCSLRNNQLWFTKPAHFNDIFESRTPLHITESASKAIDHHSMLSAYINREGLAGPLDSKQAKEVLKDIQTLFGGDLSSMTSHLVADLTSSHFDYTLKQIGACCFTAQNNNELMWAYYADSHKGFCVGYEVDEAVLRIGGFDLRPMNYVSERPKLDFWEMLFTDIASKVLFSKSINWSHEREMRIIAHMDNVAVAESRENGFLIDMPKGIEVTEIILGSRVESELEQDLIQIAAALSKKNRRHVPVKSAVPESARYNLLISDPLNPE